MNRINPIYTLALLVVILIFGTYKLGSSKSELKEAKEEYKTTQSVVDEMGGLKETYSTQKKLKSLLKSLKVDKKFKKSSVTLSSESMDVNSLNSLVGKIVNGAYNIDSMQIKKLSDDRASFQMEIKW